MEENQAKKECEDRGGKLPTRTQFIQLREAFDLNSEGLLSENGRDEFHRLFPDMKYNWFWSLSDYSKRYVWIFGGYNGNIYYDDPNTYKYSVLCTNP